MSYKSLTPTSKDARQRIYNNHFNNAVTFQGNNGKLWES